MSDAIVINITEPEDVIDVNIDQAVSGINIQNSDNSYSASASSSPFRPPPAKDGADSPFKDRLIGSFLL